ncbi:MAG TPA: hypothetical protein VGF03_11360 [Bryobacteraceae bacterium]|jgi:hypothetical protein
MPDPVDKLDFRRNEEFASLYANNVQFESSVWDLKIMFGQLDQAKGPNVIEQHTAMTVSWPEAKIAAYFLLVNIIGYQSANGPIQIPSVVVPPRPDPNNASLDEAGKKVIEYVAWIHDQFFGPNPFVPPSAG